MTGTIFSGLTFSIFAGLQLAYPPLMKRFNEIGTDSGKRAMADVKTVCTDGVLAAFANETLQSFK